MDLDCIGFFVLCERCVAVVGGVNAPTDVVVVNVLLIRPRIIPS